MPINDDSNNPIVITMRPWASSVELCSLIDALLLSVDTNVQIIMPHVMVATDMYFSVEKFRFKINFDINKFVTREPARNTM